MGDFRDCYTTSGPNKKLRYFADPFTENCAQAGSCPSSQRRISCNNDEEKELPTGTSMHLAKFSRKPATRSAAKKASQRSQPLRQAFDATESCSSFVGASPDHDNIHRLDPLLQKPQERVHRPRKVSPLSGQPCKTHVKIQYAPTVTASLPP